MKKSLRFFVLLALAAALLTVSAFADTGPKAQLKVLVKNAPEEPYYLDLLEKGDYQGHTYGSGDGDDTYSGLDWSYSEEEIAALDSELLDALRAAAEAGDPEAIKRYEATLAKRRDEYHKKKARQEEVPA